MKRVARKLVDIQESPLPSSEAMRLNKEEVGEKHQEAYIDEQNAPGQTQTQKRDLQGVEATTGSLGGMLRNYPSNEGSD